MLILQTEIMCMSIMCSGGLLGGYLGDRAAVRWPDHGRIFVVQISVATGPIFSIWLFKVGVRVNRCYSMLWIPIGFRLMYEICHLLARLNALAPC